MSDRFVTVASYALMPEAQMARNFLEAEGVPAFLAGEETASTLTGLGLGEVHLQVRDQDAARAASLLASVAAQATLDEDWEAQAEKGLFLCSLCGMALGRRTGTCPACGTANDRITTDRCDTWTASPRRPSPAPQGTTSEQVQEETPRPVTDRAAGPAEPDVASQARRGCAVVLVALLVVLFWLMAGIP
jgi:hypothetical protein